MLQCEFYTRVLWPIILGLVEESTWLNTFVMKMAKFTLSHEAIGKFVYLEGYPPHTGPLSSCQNLQTL